MSPPARRYPPIRDVLDLSPLEGDRYAAPTPRASTGRLFGGQLAAQSLEAAVRTCAKAPHSLHAYFLHPGRVDTPLELQVERLRDGRSISTRRVTAVQEGTTILTMDVSFHDQEAGEDWQPAHDIGEHPDALPVRDSPMAESPVADGFDLRPARSVGSAAHRGLHPLWIRPRDPRETARTPHALVTFLSDFGLARSVRHRRGDPTQHHSATLDHAVWFHRPPPQDGWLLLSVDHLSATAGRCLVHARLHDTSGRHLATIVQEALVRSGQRRTP